MNVIQYRRIFHCHLKKCGGTTINRWLDSFTSDERIFKTEWTNYRRSDTEVPRTCAAQDAYEAVYARASFHWSDVVYGHEGTAVRGAVGHLLLHGAAGTRQARRLAGDGLARSHASRPPGHRRCRKTVKGSRTASRLPVGEFLAGMRVRRGRAALDNYMTRVLAAGRIGRSALTADEPGGLLDIALQSLENDYDLVGVTERS